MLEVIRNLTPKPITTIINTHTHGDHVSGNVEFPATVEVIVHENTAANMQEMRASSRPRRAVSPRTSRSTSATPIRVRRWL